MWKVLLSSVYSVTPGLYKTFRCETFHVLIHGKYIYVNLQCMSIHEMGNSGIDKAKCR